MTRQRRRLLLALIYKDCATAILTDVFDGVWDRLEQQGQTIPTLAESDWLHNEIGKIADRFTRRGQNQEAL